MPLASGALRLSRLLPFISFEKYVTRAISIYQRVYQSFPPARRREEGRTSRPDILRTRPALARLFSLTREAFCSCQSPFASKPACQEMGEHLSDWFLCSLTLGNLVHQFQHGVNETHTTTVALNSCCRCLVENTKYSLPRSTNEHEYNSSFAR